MTTKEITEAVPSAPLITDHTEPLFPTEEIPVELDPHDEANAGALASGRTPATM